MPAMMQELQDKLDKKEVVLGGCRIVAPSPTHHCNACGKDFGGIYFTGPTFVRELYFYLGLAERIKNPVITRILTLFRRNHVQGN
jgi:hypothetical protein